MFFLNKERKLVITSDKDGFNQLYLYSVSGDSIKRLDKSGYDINELLGYNELSGDIFYSSYERGAVENHIYSINIFTGQKKQLSDKAGWNQAAISCDAANFIIYSSFAIL